MGLTDMETLDELRAQIDDADERLLAAFEARMRVADGIADYKREHGLPVLDASRESQKLLDVCDRCPEDLKGPARRLMTLLFELSRERQTSRMGDD